MGKKYEYADGRHIFYPDFGGKFELSFTRHFIERAEERLCWDSRQATQNVLHAFENPEMQNLLLDSYSMSEVKKGVDFILCLHHGVTLFRHGQTTKANVEIVCRLQQFADELVVITKTCLPLRAWLPPKTKVFVTNSPTPHIQMGGAGFA